MITKRIRGHSGTTPNKSLELLDPFICSHSPGDLSGAGCSAFFRFRHSPPLALLASFCPFISLFRAVANSLLHFRHAPRKHNPTH
jgi:hypothetical protein